MNKYSLCSLLFIGIFIFSCKENKTYKSVVEKPTLTDTLRFDNNSSFYIVSNLGNSKSMGDNLYSYTVEVLGIENNKITSYIPYTYTHMTNEEYLNIFFTKDNEIDCKNFFEIHIGYPACGYPQYNNYFSIYKNKVYPIVSDTSFSDSGYGVGNIYYQFCNNDGTKSITCITGSHDADEIDEQYIVSTYSDSCRFDFIKDKWVKKQITEPGKKIRSERTLLFNDDTSL